MRWQQSSAPYKLRYRMKLTTEQWVIVAAGLLALSSAIDARRQVAETVGATLGPPRRATTDFLAWWSGLSGYEKALVNGRAPDMNQDGIADPFVADWWPWW